MEQITLRATARWLLVAMLVWRGDGSTVGKPLVMMNKITVSFSGVTAVGVHPTKPDIFLAATTDLIYIFTDTSCEAIMGNQLNLAAACTLSPHFVPNGNLLTPIVHITEIIHIPALSSEAVVFVDTDNHCLITFDTTTYTSNTTDGWIGKCGSTAAVHFASFKTTILKKPESTIYHCEESSLLIVVDQTYVISCALEDSLCSDVTSKFNAFSDRIEIGAAGSDVFQYDTQTCKYFKRVGDGIMRQLPVSQPTNYPSCTRARWLSSGDVMYALVKIGGTGYIDLADTTSSSDLILSHKDICSASDSDCRHRPVSPCKDGNQGGLHDFFFYKENADNTTQIRHVSDWSSITCIPPDRTNMPIQANVFDSPVCGKIILNEVASFSQESCAYLCIRNPLCSSFVFNDLSEECVTLTCVGGQYEEYLPVQATSKCYVFNTIHQISY